MIMHFLKISKNQIYNNLKIEIMEINNTFYFHNFRNYTK